MQAFKSLLNTSVLCPMVLSATKTKSLLSSLCGTRLFSIAANQVLTSKPLVSGIENRRGLLEPESTTMTTVRTKKGYGVRNYWPRPRELYRINRHGWNAFMASPTKRRIIMKKILKGRWYMTH